MLVTVVIISCTTTGGEGQTCFGTFFVLLTNLFNCCFYPMSATCKGGLEFRETCKGALTGALCVEAMGCKCIQARARLPTSSSSSASSNVYKLDYLQPYPSSSSRLQPASPLPGLINIIICNRVITIIHQFEYACVHQLLVG